MKPQAKNENGSGTIEALSICVFFLVLLSGIFAATYLIFAKVFIQYESEQVAYCLMQNEPQNSCASWGEKRLRRFLPWGRLFVKASSSGQVHEVQIFFEWEDHQWVNKKILSPQNFLGRRALHW